MPKAKNGLLNVSEIVVPQSDKAPRGYLIVKAQTIDGTLCHAVKFGGVNDPVIFAAITRHDCAVWARADAIKRGVSKAAAPVVKLTGKAAAPARPTRRPPTAPVAPAPAPAPAVTPPTSE